MQNANELEKKSILQQKLKLQTSNLKKVEKLKTKQNKKEREHSILHAFASS